MRTTTGLRSTPVSRVLLLVMALLLVLPVMSAVAAGPGGGGGGSGGGGSGGDGGGHSDGDVYYADLVVALRDIDGVPVLAEYDVLDEETGAWVVERCVQPVRYGEIPGVVPVTNPVDGWPVWPIPLQGETLPPKPATATSGDVVVAAPPDDHDDTELEACDPQPAFAEYVTETELERLNMVRTSDDMMAMKLEEVAAWIGAAEEIVLDGGGRLVVDGVIKDAPPEYAAIFEALMTTGTLPNLPTSPALIGPESATTNSQFDSLELAASAMGVTSGKEVAVTIDTIVYYNRITDVVARANADTTDGWTLPYNESLPFASAGGMITETVPDYSGFHYDRAATFPGCATWFDITTRTYQVDPIMEFMQEQDLGFDPLPPVEVNGVVSNIAGFAQLADDARAVILYMHEHDVIPGFFIDPVGQDSCAAQQARVERPIVTWDVVPAEIRQTQTVQVTASAYNPPEGEDVAQAQLQIVLDAVDDFASADQVTAVEPLTGESVAFRVVDGDLHGVWGPAEGFVMPAGVGVTATAFDVIVAAGAPAGTYGLTLELVDLADLARWDPPITDEATTTVLPAELTVSWDVVPTTITQGVPAQVQASLLNPTPEELAAGRLRVTVDAVDDFTSADQVTAIAGAEPIPFALDGGDLVGPWGPEGGFPVASGYDVTTTFDVMIAVGAPTGVTTLTLELLDLALDPPALVASDVTTTDVVVAPSAPGDPGDTGDTGTTPGGPGGQPSDPGDETGVDPDVRRFGDLAGNVHADNIEAIAAVGITWGCNPEGNRFCPRDTVTRGQMAAFLTRALELPVAGHDYFVDDEGSVFEADINALAAAGITRGVDPDGVRFRGSEQVTRGQMAAFLRRAFAYPDGSRDHFVDDQGSVFEADIDAIADAGITIGVNPPANDRYAPDRPVARDEMASFLARARGLGS